MALNLIKCAVGRGKLVIFILGLVVAVLGCYAHFSSSWLKVEIEVNGVTFTDKPYEYCKLPNVKDCPDIAMERYFVAMAIITFVGSVCNLIASLMTDMKKYKGLDFGFHFICAILMIIAAITYFVSAMQIVELFWEQREELKKLGYSFKSTEKMVSAGLALLEAFSYAATAHNIQVY